MMVQLHCNRADGEGFTDEVGFAVSMNGPRVQTEGVSGDCRQNDCTIKPDWRRRRPTAQARSSRRSGFNQSTAAPAPAHRLGAAHAEFAADMAGGS